MFIGSADPDLGGVTSHNFFDWSYRLAVLPKGALYRGLRWRRRGLRRRRRGSGGSENIFIGSADPDLGEGVQNLQLF